MGYVIAYMRNDDERLLKILLEIHSQMSSPAFVVVGQEIAYYIRSNKKNEFILDIL